MKQRLSYVLVLALASATVGISACSGDDTGGDEDTGGSAGAAGSHAGSKTGGTSSSGSSNKAGTDSGGQAGEGGGGTPVQGGTAGSGVVPGGGDGGVAGDGGTPGGGADGGVGGVGDGGMAGTAGAGGDGGAGGGPEVVYACGSTTVFHKICSAFAAAECTIATECSDCVAQWTADNDIQPSNCAACDDKYQAFLNCGVDALESGNLSSGVECVDGVGGDLKEACYDLFFESDDCKTYLQDNPCPATWPLP